MTTTPNSPQELFNLNELSDLERVQNVMSTVGYDDTLTTVKWLTTNLRDFHFERVQELKDSGNCEQLPGWVTDLCRLNQVLSLLDDVR